MQNRLAARSLSSTPLPALHPRSPHPVAILRIMMRSSVRRRISALNIKLPQFRLSCRVRLVAWCSGFWIRARRIEVAVFPQPHARQEAPAPSVRRRPLKPFSVTAEISQTASAAPASRCVSRASLRCGEAKQHQRHASAQSRQGTSRGSRLPGRRARRRGRWRRRRCRTTAE